MPLVPYRSFRHAPELNVAMALCGATNVAELDPSVLLDRCDAPEVNCVAERANAGAICDTPEVNCVAERANAGAICDAPEVNCVAERANAGAICDTPEVASEHGQGRDRLHGDGAAVTSWRIGGESMRGTRCQNGWWSSAVTPAA